MDNEATTFESWALVEVMGHQRYAGYVTSQAVGGVNFVRVDVPQVTATAYGETRTIEKFTKLLGAASIFAITPCDEATARRAAQSYQSVPFATYTAPSFAALPAPSDEPDEGPAYQGSIHGDDDHDDYDDLPM